MFQSALLGFSCGALVALFVADSWITRAVLWWYILQVGFAFQLFRLIFVISTSNSCNHPRMTERDCISCTIPNHQGPATRPWNLCNLCVYLHGFLYQLQKGVVKRKLVVSTLGRLRYKNYPWVWSGPEWQSGLCFSLGYKTRPCLKKARNKTTGFPDVILAFSIPAISYTSCIGFYMCCSMRLSTGSSYWPVTWFHYRGLSLFTL